MFSIEHLNNRTKKTQSDNWKNTQNDNFSNTCLFKNTYFSLITFEIYEIYLNPTLWGLTITIQLYFNAWFYTMLMSHSYSC